MRILLAGATGQLGAGIREAAPELGVELIPLIRPLAGRDARARAERLFANASELVQSTLEGDVRLPYWGLEKEQLDALAGQIDAVLNVAAETNWAAARSRLTSVNLLGATNGWRLAAALRARHGRCGAYVYASSIHVAGDLTGSIAETPLPANAGRTAYEQSKWLAERSLQRPAPSADGPPIGIARIGGLLGNSSTGTTSKRNSLYLLADRWDRLPGRLLPIVAGGRVDMLPRDVAGELLLRFVASVVRMASRETQLVHVCAGESAPTTGALMAALRSGDRRGRQMMPRTVTVPARPLLFLSQNLSRVADLPASWQNFVTGSRYLAFDRVFERARLSRLVGADLPSTSTELILRLAFGVSPADSGAWEHTAELARFTG
jgi:nucleoside-diphosphate-sugar epimerase